MNYIIQEVQTSADRTSAFLPPEVQTDKIVAESVFYIKVGYAAISSIWKHTVMLFDEEGRLLKSKCYRHDANGTEVIEEQDEDAGGIEETVVEEAEEE